MDVLCFSLEMPPVPALPKPCLRRMRITGCSYASFGFRLTGTLSTVVLLLVLPVEYITDMYAEAKSFLLLRLFVCPQIPLERTKPLTYRRI